MSHTATSYVDYLTQAIQHRAQNNLDAARALSQRALSAAAVAATTRGDFSGTSAVVHHLAFYNGELDRNRHPCRAVQHYERSVRVGQELRGIVERFPSLERVGPYPHYPYIHAACHRLASYHLQCGRTGQAEHWFTQALDGSEDLERAGILRDRGGMFARLGDHMAAISDLSEAAKLFEYYGQATDAGTTLTLTGRMLIRQGSPDDAAERFRAADCMLPPSPPKLDNLIQLAVAFDRLREQPAEAIRRQVYVDKRDEALTRATSLLPDWGTTTHQVSIFVMREGGYRMLGLVDWALGYIPGPIKRLLGLA